MVNLVIHPYDVYGVHARGNLVLCFYEYDDGLGKLGITVSELGHPAPGCFTLSTNQAS